MHFNDVFLQELHARQSMPFVEFMHLALYHPICGYYSSELPKIGLEGDFITAPHLTPLFGYTVATQCQDVLSTLSDPIIFEFGAGLGRLCVDVLKHLERLESLPKTYQILEVSGFLKQKQQELIQQEIPHLASKIEWLSSWPQKSFSGVILANEVLDAMPVHRFLQTDEDLFELHVGLDATQQLTLIPQKCDNPKLLEYIKNALPPFEGVYQSEANLFLDDWLKQCSQMLETGLFLIFDYGFPRLEYYHPDRNQGTIMCHERHKSHVNALLNPGRQDITAHVDFTHVAEAAYDAGFKIAGYTSQAAFLLANGLLDLVTEQQNQFIALHQEPKRLRLQQAIRQLLQPEEMGELFKVMGLTRNFDAPLRGFLMQDKRRTL